MAKIKNKKQLKLCLQQHAQNNITIKTAANHLKITPRRFKQPAQYKTTNTTPTVGKNVGRPKQPITKETIEIRKQAHQKDHLSARYLEKIIYARQKIKTKVYKNFMEIVKDNVVDAVCSFFVSLTHMCKGGG